MWRQFCSRVSLIMLLWFTKRHESHLCLSLSKNESHANCVTFLIRANFHKNSEKILFVLNERIYDARRLLIIIFILNINENRPNTSPVISQLNEKNLCALWMIFKLLLDWIGRTTHVHGLHCIICRNSCYRENFS